jgi:hypothetical protein
MDFALATRPRGILESIAVAGLLVLRLALALMLIRVAADVAAEGSTWLPPGLAYAVGGWIAAATKEDTLLFSSMLLTGLTLIGRWRAPDQLHLEGDRWMLRRGRRTVTCWAASDVVSVAPVPSVLVWLLHALPGAPFAWRPVGGSLRGWRAIRLAGSRLQLVPLRLPLAAEQALLDRRTDAVQCRGRQRIQGAAALAAQGLGLVAVIALASLCTIWQSPDAQEWISSTPARVALAALPTDGMDGLERTRLLRRVVDAGNPEVLRLVLDRLGPEAARLDHRGLVQDTCPQMLSRLAELDPPVEPITGAQRRALRTELASTLQAMESHATLVQPNIHGRSLAALAYNARLYMLCAESAPPYWRGEWSAAAAWPKAPGGELLKPLSVDPLQEDAYLAVTLAVEAGALKTTDRFPPFDMTALMIVLDELRRIRFATPRGAATGAPSALSPDSQLAGIAEWLATLAETAHLGARDTLGRSVAYLAAAAGESIPMRIAVAVSKPDLSTPTVAGATVLHAAAAAGHFERVEGDIEWLLARGADPRARDLEGRPPSAWATSAPVADALRRQERSVAAGDPRASRPKAP